MAYGEISIGEYKLRFTGNRFVQTDDIDYGEREHDGGNRDFSCTAIREALDCANRLISQYKLLNLEVPDIELVAYDLSGKEVFCKNVVNR